MGGTKTNPEPNEIGEDLARRSSNRRLAVVLTILGAADVLLLTWIGHGVFSLFG